MLCLVSKSTQLLSIWWDLVNLKIASEGSNPKFLEAELRFIGMVNLKRRKSSKSWSLRFSLLEYLLADP